MTIILNCLDISAQSKENSEKTQENSGLQDVDGAKTILEGNGFKVLKSIGVGSYSKVKVKYLLVC